MNVLQEKETWVSWKKWEKKIVTNQQPRFLNNLKKDCSLSWVSNCGVWLPTRSLKWQEVIKALERIKGFWTPSKQRWVQKPNLKRAWDAPGSSHPSCTAQPSALGLNSQHAHWALGTLSSHTVPMNPAWAPAAWAPGLQTPAGCVFYRSVSTAHARFSALTETHVLNCRKQSQPCTVFLA